MIRIGFAKDIHQLEEGDYLLLGGIKIPSKNRIIAHSDGDVVLHAVSESLLGSLSLGDLGTYFPPEDEKYKNYSSIEILKFCYELVKKQGYKINNLDISIELENTKLKPYILDMRKSISKILDININQVSIKAMTNEKMDATGSGKAIVAYCVCLVGDKYE